MSPGWKATSSNAGDCEPTRRRSLPSIGRALSERGDACRYKAVTREGELRATSPPPRTGSKGCKHRIDGVSPGKCDDLLLSYRQESPIGGHEDHHRPSPAVRNGLQDACQVQKRQLRDHFLGAGRDAGRGPIRRKGRVTLARGRVLNEGN